MSEADVVYFFLMPDKMERLRTKFEKELKSGAKVVSYVWPIPGWETENVDKKEGFPDLFLYKR